MPYSIELFFDDATAIAIKTAWHTLASVTESPYMVNNGVRPHIALGVLESFDDRLNQCLSTLAGETPPFSVTMSDIDSFRTGPAVVFVGFDSHGELDAIHKRVQALLSKLNLECHPYYQSGQWKPHCTLAMEFPKPRLTEALTAASRIDFRLPYKVEVVGTVEYPPSRITWERRLRGEHPVAGYGPQARRT